MNIYKVNLNLLKVFQVLMKEKQVTLTAKKLHLTQSAISNSLHQLRDLFKDELFIRGTKNLIPTKKALDLAPQVDQALKQIDSFLSGSEIFDPKTSARTFLIGMTDYVSFVLVPSLYDYLKKNAPNICIKVVSVDDFSAEIFTNGKIELGIGLERKIDKQLNHELLFNDTAVCVARVDHPIFQKRLTLERYLQADHIRTCAFSHELTQTDIVLAQLNLKRNVKISLPEILPALTIIAHSDLIGTFSKKIVMQSIKSHRVKFVLPPLQIPDVNFVQIWHRQQQNDPGLSWLRTIIKTVTE